MPTNAVLLPPSDDKKAGGNPFAPDMFDYRSSDTFNYFNVLNPERRALVKKLQEAIETAGADGISGMFGATGDALSVAVEVTRKIFSAPLMSALKRYSPGALFSAMDFPGLPTGAQRRLLENGIVFSGLFGLLRPDDLIPMYHLGMDATIPGLGSVAEYWKPTLSPHLNELVAGRVVWDFLPEFHHRAWDDTQAYERRIQVRFVSDGQDEEDGTEENVLPLVGHLVSLIVRTTTVGIQMLQGWTHPAGYRYDEDRSCWNEETKAASVVMAKV